VALGGKGKPADPVRPAAHESVSEVLWRAARSYAFVGALILLGGALTPFANRYLLGLSPTQLYWANMVSAILDNATLAAAEVTSRMSHGQLDAAMLGLIISGGMLIPGNIPNIVAAQHLRIKSREWAAFAVPVGLVLLVCFHFVLVLGG
jgi:predicted cation transporter